MYGLVNKLLQEFLVDEHGVELPEVDYDVFKPYDDSITTDLLDAAVASTSVSRDELLLGFGVYFIEAAFRFYPYLLRAHGQTLGDLLYNLNRLHDNARTIFVAYDPPSFVVESRGDLWYRIEYTSSRKGLEPFVEGLLVGCVRWFGEDFEVERNGSQFLLHKPQ